MNQEPNSSYIESVLRQYGIEKVRRGSKGFIALCPFHNEQKPSFSISDTGLWLCHSCKEKGNIFQFHNRLGGGKMDWREALKAMGNQLEAPAYAKPRSSGTIDLPSDFIPYPNPESVPPYVLGRLKWETIQYFGLGSSESSKNRGRVVIPIRYKGKAIGYHSRALTADMEPRYYNPYGFNIKDNVFNWDSCVQKTELIVLEGAFNAMSMREKGFKNTVSVFGTQYTAAQMGRIFDLHPSSVVICFDRDKSKIVDGKEQGRAGQKAAKKFGENVSALIPVYIMPLPVGKDPNILDASTILECYKKKVSYESIWG